MADDLDVIVVQRETDGLWDVSCFNELCGYGLHDVGESESKGKAEAMATRHRTHIRREAARLNTLPVETVTIPREAYEQLVRVAAYVSRGRRFVGVEPYPDATARRALGALPEMTES